MVLSVGYDKGQKKVIYIKIVKLINAYWISRQIFLKIIILLLKNTVWRFLVAVNRHICY